MRTPSRSDTGLLVRACSGPVLPAPKGETVEGNEGEDGRGKSATKPAKRKNARKEKNEWRNAEQQTNAKNEVDERKDFVGWKVVLERAKTGR